jgi:hypothetical protein
VLFVAASDGNVESRGRESQGVLHTSLATFHVSLWGRTSHACDSRARVVSLLLLLLLLLLAPHRPPPTPPRNRDSAARDHRPPRRPEPNPSAQLRQIQLICSLPRSPCACACGRAGLPSEKTRGGSGSRGSPSAWSKRRRGVGCVTCVRRGRARRWRRAAPVAPSRLLIHTRARARSYTLTRRTRRTRHTRHTRHTRRTRRTGSRLDSHGRLRLCAALISTLRAPALKARLFLKPFGSLESWPLLLRFFTIPPLRPFGIRDTTVLLLLHTPNPTPTPTPTPPPAHPGSFRRSLSRPPPIHLSQ